MSVTTRPSSIRLALCLIASLFASSLWAEDAKAPEGHAIGTSGFNDMLGKQIKPGTLATEQQSDGSFLLTNKMQTVSAHITPQGTQFDSIGNSEGKGGFSLQLTQWGRENNLQAAESSKLYRDGDVVFHTHKDGIAEKFSNTSNGIQQDFIIPVKPEGEGALHVQLQVIGATVKAKDNGASIQLASGRNLTYDRLAVTDSAGKTIPAHIALAQNNVLDVVVDDATAQYPLTIDPTVGNGSWGSLGSGTSGVVTSSVFALALDSSGNLYAGGGFTTAGGVAANRIAKWDGSTWSAMGSGLNDAVRALALDSSGNLYVGGQFTAAGGVVANYIAKWNGSSWSALGSGMAGGVAESYTSVDALVVDSSGNVYAGGNFTTAGGVSANHIAQWNGSSWSTLGVGMGSVTSADTIGALALDGSGNLYAGGHFSTAGGVVANSIAKWNGSSWSALGSGLYPAAAVNALVLDGSGNLYASGHFSETSDGSVTGLNNIAEWNGSVWNALGLGITASGSMSSSEVAVNALMLDSSGNLYVGGSFNTAGGIASTNNIAVWNGSTWRARSSGMSGALGGTVYALAQDSSGNLYAGGGFATAGGATANNIAKWTFAPSGKIVKNDFDGDGKSDVLFLNSTTGGTQYWSAATKAQAVYPGTYDTSYTYAGSGDFNGDGKADLFFTRASNNGTLIWSGAVKTAASYPGVSVAGFTVAAICDVDGDGLDDVVWFNATTGGTQIWPAATKASVTYPGTQNTAYTVVACGDFDGDGKADLFWRNATTGADEIWLSANKSTKLYPGLLPDPSWSVIGAGDTNGDGKADLVWYQAQNPLDSSIGSIAIWLGGMKTQAIYPGSNGNALTPVAIGDYNGDGDADLLWINSSTHGIEIWSGVRKGESYESYPGLYPAGFSVQK